MRKFVIGAIAIGAWLILGALRVSDFSTLRDEMIDTAESRAQDLALILSEYIGQTFASGDASLRQLALHGQRVGGARAPAAAWQPSLSSARAGLTNIGSISVVDATGIIRHSTLSEIVGQSRRELAMFEQAARASSDELIVGAPFHSPLDPPRVVIPLARRLVRADGEFDGLVVAAYVPAPPRNFFRRVEVGAGGSVWVIHPQGVVMFHEPSASDEIGQSAQQHPVFNAATAQRQPGVIHGPIEPGGAIKVTAFHTSATSPLIVAVSLDRAEVLTAWRRLARGSGTVFLLIATLLAATLWFVFRQLDQKAAAQEALQNARRIEAERLRAANEELEATLEREQRARREAEEANAIKDQFVMTVSHELRTPLTAIAGWARMLVDGMVDDSKKDAALRTIERNAQAQKRLIEDMLDVSGIMSGKMRLDVRPVAIADVVKIAVEAIAPAVAAKKIHLDTSIDPTAGVLSADPERLQQIIWNLLSNAVKFTPAGGRVSIAVTRRGNEIEIVVTDTGAGIKPDFLPHVFERFRQANPGPSRKHGGLGLGLAIVRNLVELHGGSVAAHSDGEGHGATFIVRLPAPVTVPAQVG